MLSRTKITVIYNEFKVKTYGSLYANNEHVFSFVKLKTTGHGEEVYKRPLLKSKEVFYHISWLDGHAKEISNKYLKFCHI